MASGNQRPKHGSSEKARLSYLLNYDDDAHQTFPPSRVGSYGQPSRMQQDSFPSHRQDPSAYGRARGSSAANHVKNLQARQRTYSTERMGIQQPVGDSTSHERKGVRKKRQRKFICDRCNFGFYTNSDLQKHISSVHLQLKPYECRLCDKKFGERSNATKHFKSVHERQKNAACDQCHKVFAFRDGLVRHVRLVHENVRNFHCQFPGCGASFKQSAHLKKHETIHTRRLGIRAADARVGNGKA